VPTPREIIESLRENPHPDAKVLFHLAEVGSDLTKPVKPDFALYFSNETAARAAEWKLTDEGFEVTVEPPHDNHEQYLVIAVITVVPTLEAIRSLSERFHDLAEELGGDYDGWDAEAVD
jgi:Regulator of ribonuclease activity B